MSESGPAHQTLQSHKPSEAQKQTMLLYSINAIGYMILGTLLICLSVYKVAVLVGWGLVLLGVVCKIVAQVRYLALTASRQE